MSCQSLSATRICRTQKPSFYIKQEPIKVAVCYLLSWCSCLASMQTVQQVKCSNADLKAERRQEEAVGRVQDQACKHSLLTRHQPAAKDEQITAVMMMMRYPLCYLSVSLSNAGPTIREIRLTRKFGRTSFPSIFRRRFRSGQTL